VAESAEWTDRWRLLSGQIEGQVSWKKALLEPASRAQARSEINK